MDRAALLVNVDLSRETDVQRAVMRVYQAFGCEVRRFNEGRRTRISEGWPDLMVFCPQKGLHWAHEVKVPGGLQSSEQTVMEMLARRSGLEYVLGGIHEAQEQLRKVGLIADALHESFR